jgi:hypothetical protein
MKKLLLLLVALTLLIQPVSAAGIKAGAGVFGGLAIPVAQDDQSQGSVFGFKGRVKAMSIFTLEPNIAFTKYGDPDLDNVIDDPPGAKLTSFGLDVLLGSSLGAPGVSPFFFAGIGSYKLKNDDMLVDESDVGISGGIGLEIGLGQSLGLEGRGRFLIVGTEGGASKKDVTLTAGVNYHFEL